MTFFEYWTNTNVVEAPVIGGVEPFVSEAETHVPILMYHYVRDISKSYDPLGWNLSVTPELFEKQLKWLSDEGYVSVHLSDLLDGAVPEKAIVLSFDDGLEDFYTNALPLLKQYGFTATNSVVTGMVGAHEHMSAEQIQVSIDEGIEIISHTVSHVDLANMDEAEIRRQLTESREYLKKQFGIDSDFFVYPSGKYNDMVVRVLGEEGYKLALTTQPGEVDLASDDMLLLPRIRIDNRDGFDGFLAKLNSLK
ncbi:MAG: polysaccharide deacetylase family protein [bacterium]|nr:polysaccharide deacetylase family protein [bacterium]